MSDASTAARWVREEIRAQRSYHVPEARDVIKLDAMENPWSLPRELDEKWRASLAGLSLNRYPDPRAGQLHTGLRQVMQIPQQADILLGNGSDEVIQLILMAVAGKGRSVLAPAPSFVMYEVLARACGLRFHGVPLDEQFALDMPRMLAAIDEFQPAVVFLASPNNPTGNAFDGQAVEALLRQAPGLVVLDEAYLPFSDGSYMDHLAEFPNLVVMRTLSKVGLAGIRLGVLAGHHEWLSEFDKLRLPYNINSLTQATAAFALDHWTVFQQQITAIRQQRARVAEQLAAHQQLTVWPSETNFILFRVPAGQAGRIHEALLDGGILVKNLHGQHDMLRDCLRVTIGTPTENDKFLDALTDCLQG
jgi:histidinol-phosphate aminotransferase